MAKQTQTVTSSDKVKGEVLNQYRCPFGARYGDNSKTTVHLVLVDGPFLRAADKMCGDFAADVCVSRIRIVDKNDENKVLQVVHPGDVVVFMSGKTKNPLIYSKRSIDIVAMYVAAYAYYSVLVADNPIAYSPFEVEEKAIAWMALLSNDRGYWRSTIFNTLEKYDSRVRKYEKKYFSDVKKRVNVDCPYTPDEQREYDQIFARLTA